MLDCVHTILGCCQMKIEYGGQIVENGTLIVVDTVGPTLFGRDLLCKIKLNWQEIHQMRSVVLN